MKEKAYELLLLEVCMACSVGDLNQFNFSIISNTYAYIMAKTNKQKKNS